MARTLRPHAISGRISEQDFDTVNAYVEQAQIAIADLIRLAITEYIKNNPIKEK